MKKHLTITIITGLILVLCSQITVQSQQPKSSPYLDDIIQTKMTNAHIPGLASCIVKEGQIRWIGTYGYAYIDEGIPVDTSTLFYLASISKTVTVTALMQLWEEGEFELDDDINDYLDFEVKHPVDSLIPITFKMLCTHTSSIKDHWDIMPWYWGEDPPPLDEFLFDYLSPDGALYNQNTNFYYNVPPGTQHYYSNIGVALIGYLVELMGDSTFPYQTYERIFEPLQMNEVSWFLSELDTMHMAMPYSWNGSGYTPYWHYSHAEYPCGGLRTSVDQLANFLLCYMNGGTNFGQEILNYETVDMILTPQIPQINPDIGLLWYVANYAGQIYCGHSGGNLGCKTSMYFRPADDIGVIILTNGESDFTDLASQIFDYAADSMEVHCFEEGITFTTQEEIDNFQVNYPYCSDIEGDVEIGEYPGSNITNLDGLSVLNSLGGSLEIFNNPLLNDLSGLDNMNSIVGNLEIYNNEILGNLSGLENLSSIGGWLGIGKNLSMNNYVGNPSLTNIESLMNLNSIGGGITIIKNNNLTSLFGLNNVTSIEGGLNIRLNTSLTNLLGLDNLTSIGDNMLGYGLAVMNTDINNLTGLNNITSIDGTVIFIANNSLTSLNGLDSLNSINDKLWIQDNEVLESLMGLANLTSISGELIIHNNDDLESLTGLDNINPGSIDNLKIYDNESLSICDIFSVCEYLIPLGGESEIYNNAIGCNSPEEVMDSCIITSVNEIKYDESFTIFPNPIGSTTLIQYTLQTISQVTIKVLDLSGKEIIILVNEKQPKGDQQLVFNTSGLPAGVYFCVLKTSAGMQTKKLIKME